ncbi:hypothetical protein [Catalinimonas niigatensis]|uniref:hypothetical protein n=1 Tax=Catalinimonas niigatensis TaxID=1397264 RepID=UPI0026658A0C|nr:hypothetical protein [Catalinimonas niigatensis]WPP53048.1 hypothetical protein PZB72_11740 [Catalinimonas niigatensis]
MSEEIQLTLQQVLSGGEEQQVATLKSIYRQQQGREYFVRDLLSLLGMETYQKAASWLLKHHIEQGNALTDQEMWVLAENMQPTYGWESRLHLLQILPFITIPPDAQLRVEDFVRASLSSANKFVRAWAIQGLYELSHGRPDLQREVSFLCEKAMQTEAPSVKARVRKILVQLDKA